MVTSKKSHRDLEFPNGLPSKHCPGPILLDISDRTRTSFFFHHEMSNPATATARRTESLPLSRKTLNYIPLWPIIKANKIKLNNVKHSLGFNKHSVFYSCVVFRNIISITRLIKPTVILFRVAPFGLEYITSWIPAWQLLCDCKLDHSRRCINIVFVNKWDILNLDIWLSVENQNWGFSICEQNLLVSRFFCLQ